MPTCKNCQTEFTIYPEDIKFYQKIGVPAPTFCPGCRAQRRLCWRNDRTLYKRKCAATGQEIISMYSPEAPVVVYEQKVWWGDGWDALDYGREFDFTRPFFSQFAELQKVTPHFSMYNMNPVNSDFINYARDNKNCYLCFSMVKNEDCYYCQNTDNSCDCLDCISAKEQSEKCYEGVDIDHCYACGFVQNCSNLIDCWFCYNCVGCQNCLGSVNLRNASYCWFNEQLTPEEFQVRLKKYFNGSFAALEIIKQKFHQHLQRFPRKNLWLIKTVNSSGDYLLNTKNARDCFDVYDAEDCSYLWRSLDAKDAHDVYGLSEGELMYENISTGVGRDTAFSLMSYYNQGIRYSDSCFSSQNLFGCVSLRHKKYCILNKEYTEKEYNRLVPKIIEHMKQGGEWGEFFSAKMSPFGYNETLAQENFPLTKEEALSRGFNWRDNLPFTVGQETIKPEDLADNIAEVKDNILQEVLACAVCQKNYKLIRQELKFYQEQNLPLPRLCPNCRHAERLKLRNPRRLYQRKCDKCGVAMQTAYSLDRPEKVYCEECYRQEIY